MGESLAGSTALITGAAKRVGRATALALAREGVNIIIHYRSSESETRDVIAELGKHGVRSWTVCADLSRPDEYEGLAARALEAAGALNILVNNASIFFGDTLDNATLESVTSNAQVNAWAPLVLSREFRRLAKRGTIVNVLDAKLAGLDTTHVSYILSKHVLAVLTEMMALEFAPEITVNAVAPALILPPPGKDEAYLDSLIDTVPLKRHGAPEDIADAVVFLAKSRFITGETIYVDGGWHLRR
jgi:pteridine reductase